MPTPVHNALPNPDLSRERIKPVKASKEAYKNGQFLVETLIAMGAAVIIIGSLVASVSMVIKNAQFSRNQTLATKYATEGMEWIRSQRDSGWTVFATRSGTYCLNSLSWSSGACVGNMGTTLFKREAVLSALAADKMSITVTVTWTDPDGTHKSNLSSYLTKW